MDANPKGGASRRLCRFLFLLLLLRRLFLWSRPLCDLLLRRALPLLPPRLGCLVCAPNHRGNGRSPRKNLCQFLKHGIGGREPPEDLGLRATLDGIRRSQSRECDSETHLIFPCPRSPPRLSLESQSLQVCPWQSSPRPSSDPSRRSPRACRSSTSPRSNPSRTTRRSLNRPSSRCGTESSLRACTSSPPSPVRPWRTLGCARANFRQAHINQRASEDDPGVHREEALAREPSKGTTAMSRDSRREAGGEPSTRGPEPKARAHRRGWPGPPWIRAPGCQSEWRGRLRFPQLQRRRDHDGGLLVSRALSRRERED